MTCKFCGCDTPDSKGNCKKCGQPMVDDDATVAAKDVKGGGEERPTTRHQERGAIDLKATIRENIQRDTSATVIEAETKCPNCGYDLENGACSSCGYNSVESKDNNNSDKNTAGKKTVRPQRKGEKEGSFTLTPISEDTGQPEGDFILFERDEVELNRENTDPKNDTITSKLQAVITHKDGKWHVVDRSELRTTFVHAADEIELQDGSLILLGNQLYQFNKISSKNPWMT